MKSNEGKVDRAVRIVLGAGILGAGAYFQNWFGLIGIVPLATGLFGTCLLYKPFGISTKKKA